MVENEISVRLDLLLKTAFSVGVNLFLKGEFLLRMEFLIFNEDVGSYKLWWTGEIQSCSLYDQATPSKQSKPNTNSIAFFAALAISKLSQPKHPN